VAAEAEAEGAEAAPEQVAEQELAPEAEQAREQVARQELASVHPVLVRDMGMAARMVSATAVRYRPRPRGTRCKRRFRVLKPAARITAH
jgi:hypothetical protein